MAEIGGAVEATPSDDLLVGWQPHADTWCALGPGDFDDDFFTVYGGAHVLPALVAFLDSYCGHDEAAALVAAAQRMGSARAWHRRASRLRASIWTSSSLASAARKRRWTS